MIKKNIFFILLSMFYTVFSVEQPKELRIAVISNRGPLEHYFTQEGKAISNRESDGGLATALSLLVKKIPVTWIANAYTPADRIISNKVNSIKISPISILRLVTLTDTSEKVHHNFCNTVLWFLHHSMLDKLIYNDLEQCIQHGWDEGYLPVNIKFADALMSYEGCIDAVMIHDYHFYALPRLLRQKCKNLFIQYFVHIPWPEVQQWEILPHKIVCSICRSLLANDSIVFQTKAFMYNFFETCMHFVPEVKIDKDAGKIIYNNSVIRAWVNPVSVDIAHLKKQVDQRHSHAEMEELGVKSGQKIILRIDRIDPIKNIDIGFEAFAFLLEHYPDWREKVCFLAQIYSSRTTIKEYAEYNSRVFQLVQDINKKFGTSTWKPIIIIDKPDRFKAILFLTCYDVLLVNSLADGLNLVSKEGVVLNTHDGVLVLSKKVGSYDELYQAALGINPENIQETAQALNKALNMPLDERHKRLQILKKTIEYHQSNNWIAKLLHDAIRNK